MLALTLICWIFLVDGLRGPPHEFMHITGSTVRPAHKSANDVLDCGHLHGLNAAIVGAGPSGLLLAHRLLKAGSRCVSLFEYRSDPRLETANLEGRAYALGLGIRGRTAIRTVDEQLWDAVKSRGFESERFDLHLSPKIRIRLRDSPKQISQSNGNSDVLLEPSVLLFQSDLCGALLDELETRYISEDMSEGTERLNIIFQGRVEHVDLDRRTIKFSRTESAINKSENGLEIEELGPFDVIVGCDGVNSRVRRSIEVESPGGAFISESQVLPGYFKVARVPKMPLKLDPTSIHLLLPSGKGESLTAFVEPTANGGACLLFAGRPKSGKGRRTDDSVFYATAVNNDAAHLGKMLLGRFPLLKGINETNVMEQLLSQSSSSASSVKCNVYHCGEVALCGDAAHATGGVSGQGCNSALMDSAVLSDCLERLYHDTDSKQESIRKALLAYSQHQVPEGLALYDLSFGPQNSGVFKRIRYQTSTLLSTIFGGRFGVGRERLQTMLTTSLVPFSKVRRDRDPLYEEQFPSAATFNETLSSIFT